MRHRRGVPRRSLVAIALLMSLPSCDEPSAPPPDSVIPMFDFNVVAAENPDVVFQPTFFFAGGSTSRFTVAVGTEGDLQNTPLTAYSGSENELVTFHQAGSHLITFPGNVGVIKFQSSGLVNPPFGFIEEIVLSHRNDTVFPEVEDGPADRVSAYPMRLGEPVEVIFPEDGTALRFLSISGVGGKTLDVLLDGTDPAADLHVNTDAAAGFALAASGAEMTLPATAGGFLSMTLPASRDTLYLTLAKRAEPTGGGVVRLTVVDATDQIGVDVSLQVLAVPLVGEGSQAAVAILRDAVTDVYGVTGGKVRVDAASVRPTPGLGLLDVDIIVVPPTGIPGIDTQLAGRTVMLATGDPWTDARLIARAIFHAKFDLPLEEELGSDPCPNSLMSGFPFALCWQGNHNPFGLEITEISAWTRLAAQIGVMEPSRTPTRILRFNTTVAVPVEVTIQ